MSTIKQVSGSSSYTGGAFPNGRSVTLSPYSIGQYEVTNQFYVAVMGGIAPSENGRDSYMPAEKFNFYRAAVFCNKLSALFGYTPFYNIGGKSSGFNWNSYSSSDVVNIPTSDTTSWTQFTVNTDSNGYRLPTEPQWELAARGGVQNGTQWSYKYSGSNTYTDVAWFKANSSGTKKTVGQKTSNRLDLYDMSGNVYEWLTDYNNNPSGSETCTNPIITYSDSRKSENKILYKGAGFATSDTSKWPVDYNSEKTAPWNSAGDVGMRICRNATCTQ